MRACSVLAWLFLACSWAAGGEPGGWWNPNWRYRTSVVRPAPYRDTARRPVEVAIDFPLLLQRAGVKGDFDPQSLRVVLRGGTGPGRLVPFARRSEWNPRERRTQEYLAWLAEPVVGAAGEYDIYFETKDRNIEPLLLDPAALPPENLLANPGFEALSDDLPQGWTVTPRALVRSGRFAHTDGERSLQIVVDETTPAEASRTVVISQKVDVRPYAGQEMLFECDLLAQRAAYGAPVSMELEQYRADGSRIPEYAVQPRWLTIELAEGQLVQFRQRGRFSPLAAELQVRIQVKCFVEDEDTGSRLGGPESRFTVWLDRLVLRPGERWPWPAASGGGFVEGALRQAPLNRGFEFTGLRRLAFNGASEGTLTSGRHDQDPRSVHWGLQAGTLEFWCRPKWNSEDGRAHVFFEGIAYGHRVQSRFRKLGADGENQLEFSVADTSGRLRSVRARAALRSGRWHHLAATWDFPKAELRLFVDGKPVGAEGPRKQPWPFSLSPRGETGGPGIGIDEDDRRSLPMQAFLGGDARCSNEGSAEAILDEVRISDVPRYADPFVPAESEFALDQHTRALFHLENERHGVHDSGDQFVFGHLACELQPCRETASLEVLHAGTVEARQVAVQPYASDALFAKNRAENRLTVTRPWVVPPDPRYVEYRPRQAEWVLTRPDDEFAVRVGGDFEPLMQWIRYEVADPASGKATLLAHWRANDNVVPFSPRDLAATLAPRAGTDAERAFEVFRYALATTNYYDADYSEILPSQRRRPVDYTLTKALNIYPFDQCGPLNHMLRKLFLAAGISSNDASGTHHQFEQAFYQGDYRLFDLSPRLYWLERDNEQVVSRRAFEDDLYLKLRQGSAVSSALPGRVSRARFGTAVRPHSMDFPLRAGERVSFAWHNEGRWFEGAGNRRGEPVPLAKIPPYFGNGVILFEPLAGSPAMRQENIQLESPATLRPADPAQPAALVYQLTCPYILADAVVQGTYSARQARSVRVSVSGDGGKRWTPVWENAEPSGPIDAPLRAQVAAHYAYQVKLELDAGAGASVSGLKVRTTFVASPLALPGRLALGQNRIRPAGGPASAPIKTAGRWVERHLSKLGVSLNSIGYYMNGDQAHRNLYVVRPGEETAIRVALLGEKPSGKVRLEGLPAGWTAEVRSSTGDSHAASVSTLFALRAGKSVPGEIQAMRVAVGEGKTARRVPVQVLVADAPLVREAEAADGFSGDVAKAPAAELSGACGVEFRGGGHVAFDLSARRKAEYALWLRARWEPESSPGMRLTIDGGPARELRATAMIGFTDWNDPRRAHTKMFAHFGEQFAHWSWYRIGDLQLTAGRHRLTLGAERGAWFDALLVLPQDPAIDRAAMNLFQNWNFAPWDSEL